MKTLFTVLFITGFVFSASAQKSKITETGTFKRGWAVGAGMGVSWYFAEGNDFIRNHPYDYFSIIDNGGFKVRTTLAYHFSPVIALRESLGYTQNHWPDPNDNHIVKSFGEEWLATDFVLNLSNFLAGFRTDRKFDISAFTGACINLRNKVTPEGDPWFNIQGRAGMQSDFHLYPQLAFNLIAEANVVGDKHNDLVISSPFQLLLSLSVGICYYFHP